jgi:hypothetical protein
MSDRKLARQSKVLWFNALAGGLFALEASANLIQPYVPGNVYAWGVLALTVGNAVLRFYTRTAIKGTP